MDFSKYETQCWFIQLKNNMKDFKDMNNVIESAKFGYDRDLKVPQWILGIGIAVLAFGKDVIQTLQPFLQNIAIIVYLLTIITLLIGILWIIEMAGRHRISMMYLYREKDKQDNKKKGTHK